MLSNNVFISSVVGSHIVKCTECTSAVSGSCANDRLRYRLHPWHPTTIEEGMKAHGVDTCDDCKKRLVRVNTELLRFPAGRTRYLALPVVCDIVANNRGSAVLGVSGNHHEEPRRIGGDAAGLCGNPACTVCREARMEMRRNGVGPITTIIIVDDSEIDSDSDSEDESEESEAEEEEVEVLVEEAEEVGPAAKRARREM